MHLKILKSLNILKQKNSNFNYINKHSELYLFFLKIYAKVKSKQSKTNVFINRNPDYAQTLEKKFWKPLLFWAYVLCCTPNQIGYLFGVKEKKTMGNQTENFKVAEKILVDTFFISTSLQQIIYLILTAIYNRPIKSVFNQPNYVFKKPHNALQFIKNNFKDIKWVIEGRIEIKNCYEFLTHKILMQLLEKRIQRGKFVFLIKKIVNNGIKKKVNFNEILLNIYFYEIDIYILEQIKNKISQNKYKKHIFRVNDLKRCIKKYKKFLKKKSFQKLKKAKNQMFYQNLSINIKYVRYADSWLIGIAGNLNLAKNIEHGIQDFLQKKNYYKKSKIKIIHVCSKAFSFLGYKINIDKKHVFKFNVPTLEIIKKLYQKGFCTISGFPTSKKSWTTLENHIIVKNFNFLLTSLTSYYLEIYNRKSLKNLQHILQYSCAMTLGHKHRMKIPQIFKKVRYFAYWPLVFTVYLKKLCFLR